MDILTIKNKERVRKSRLKTICTLETNDRNLAQSYGKENRMRNSPLLTQKQKSHERSQVKQSKKKSSANHFQSQYSVINQSQLRESTPKNIFKRAMSINQGKNIRLKTEYSNHEDQCIRRMMGSLKKKLVYPCEEVQFTQSIHIIRKFYESDQEQYYQVKRGKKEIKSVLIKTKSIVTKKQYETEMRITNGLSNIFKERQQDIFLKIDRVYKSQKEWVIVTQNYFHPTWSEDRYYLLLSQFKNNGELLLGLIRQVVQAVFITSHNGYAHGNIGIQCLYFPIYKGNLRLEGDIKIGGLSRAFHINRKEMFLAMPVAYRTPPQILNFMRFEAKQEFDRESLQYIGYLNEGWRIDTWAIGILVLQLLNGDVLAGEGCEMGELIDLQRQILIRYSYLLCKVDERMKIMLMKMLSLNPSERPHPRQLMKML